jgi:hypothetical protein
VVDIGHVGGTGGVNRGRDGRSQGRTAAGLQQQDGREKVVCRFGESHALANLLDEDVLVADHKTRLVGRRGDLIRIDHGDEPVGGIVGMARFGDAVEREHVLRRGVASVGPRPVEPFRGIREGGRERLAQTLRRPVRHLDSERAVGIRGDDLGDLGFVGELVVVARAGSTG